MDSETIFGFVPQINFDNCHCACNTANRDITNDLFQTMKRAQASSPLQGSSSHKKLKISSSGEQESDHDDNAGGWTKVEKRKAKKAQKTVAKFDVRFLIFSLHD